MEPQRTRMTFCIFAALTFFGSGKAIPISDVSLANPLTSAMDRVANVLLDVTQQLKNIDRKLGTIAGHLTKQDPAEFQCFKGMYFQKVTTFPRVPFMVLDGKAAMCDTQTDGGGWIVLQRRKEGNENFNRTWSEYKSGFGDVFGEGDFWVGNDVIHQLTASAKYELRVDIGLAFGSTNMKSRYNSFYVGDEASSYTMTLGQFSGQADVLKHQNNTGFSTYDRDNDAVEVNLAQLSGGGWWHNGTDGAQLNGEWRKDESGGFDPLYNYDKNSTLVVNFTEMKIRPLA